MPEPTATPTPGGYQFNPDDGGGDAGRGPVTGSTMVDGWAHWVYADGSTSPKSGAQQTAGGGGDRATGQVIKLPDGSTWQVNAPKQPLLSALSDTPSGGPPTQTVTNTQTGQTLQLPPGQYELVSGEHVFITPGGILLEAEAPDGTGPTRTGVQAPDPYGAALLKFKEYDAAIERGDMVAKDANAAWQRDFDEITANRDIAAEKIAAEQRLQDTATRRGQLEFDILQSSLPEGQSLNLGAAGIVPQNIVNVQDMLTQGLPPLAEQYAGIGGQLTPITGLPDVGPLQLPPTSMLDFVDPLAAKTEAGSAGFLV